MKVASRPAAPMISRGVRSRAVCRGLQDELYGHPRDRRERLAMSQ